MRAGIDYVGVTTCFILTDGHGNVLIHRRTKNCRDEVGKWDFGAGQLEVGLSFEENVLKEVREEFGCAGTIVDKYNVLEVHRMQEDGTGTHWLAIYFLVLVNPEEVVNNEPHKIELLHWTTLDKLPSPLRPTAAQIVDRVQKSLASMENS